MGRVRVRPLGGAFCPIYLRLILTLKGAMCVGYLRVGKNGVYDALGKRRGCLFSDMRITLPGILM